MTEAAINVAREKCDHVWAIGLDDGVYCARCMRCRGVRELLEENQRLRALLRLGRDLSAGVTGADADDAIGSIKVHFEIAPSQYLAVAFEEWQHAVTEVIG